VLHSSAVSPKLYFGSGTKQCHNRYFLRATMPRLNTFSYGETTDRLSHDSNAIVQLPSTVSRSQVDGEKLPRIKLLIVSDETIFREGLRVLLHTSEICEVVDCCSTGDALVSASRRSSPELILLGSGPLGRETADALQAIKDSGSNVKVVLLCRTITREETVRALQLGAHGIVLRTDSTESLFQCIRKVMDGDYWLSGDGVTNLVKTLCEPVELKKPEENRYGLTAREREIVQVVLDGYSNPEIAAHCSISEQTVKHHLSHVFDKLGVYSRLELALFAVHHLHNLD
jgi:two-component system nitrate/nitrite response regulator NarL